MNILSWMIELNAQPVTLSRATGLSEADMVTVEMGDKETTFKVATDEERTKVARFVLERVGYWNATNFEIHELAQLLLIVRS